MDSRAWFRTLVGCLLISMFISGSEECDCNHHGTCIDSRKRDPECNCYPGYHGNKCQDSVCDHFVCNHGNCKIIDGGQPTCDCDTNYIGDLCDKYNYCVTENCNGHGQCGLTSADPFWECTCNHGYLGKRCETFGFGTCNEVSLVRDVVMHASNNHAGAAPCVSGSLDSPEALIMNHCSVSLQTASWQKGIQVMSSANCSSTPMYTPVAMFTGSQYVASANDNVAGAFVGCLPTGGFKLAVQQCGQYPMIVHIDSTSSNDPFLYYTVV